MYGNHMKSNFSRRAMLDKMCVGFGGLAFNSILANPSFSSQVNDFPNIKPRAKSIRLLLMHGEPSHMDLFDSKPALKSNHGKTLPFPERKVQFAESGNICTSMVIQASRSVWPFDVRVMATFA